MEILVRARHGGFATMRSKRCYCAITAEILVENVADIIRECLHYDIPLDPVMTEFFPGIQEWDRWCDLNARLETGRDIQGSSGNTLIDLKPEEDESSIESDYDER